MKSFLADINVWLSIVYDGHAHHRAALNWFMAQGPEQVLFCRLTQIGFLRLLTNRTIMGDDVKSQAEAWSVFDALGRNARVTYLDEPAGVTEAFRRLTQGQLPASKAWSDAYLAALALRSGSTVATFDRDFLLLEAPALLLA